MGLKNINLSEDIQYDRIRSHDLINYGGDRGSRTGSDVLTPVGLQRIPSWSGSHSHFKLGTTYYKLHMWWVRPPTRPLASGSCPPFRATSVIPSILLKRPCTKHLCNEQRVRATLTIANIVLRRKHSQLHKIMLARAGRGASDHRDEGRASRCD